MEIKWLPGSESSHPVPFKAMNLSDGPWRSVPVSQKEMRFDLMTLILLVDKSIDC